MTDEVRVTEASKEAWRQLGELGHGELLSRHHQLATRLKGDPRLAEYPEIVRLDREMLEAETPEDKLPLLRELVERMEEVPDER